MVRIDGVTVTCNRKNGSFSTNHNRANDICAHHLVTYNDLWGLFLSQGSGLGRLHLVLRIFYPGPPCRTVVPMIVLDGTVQL